MKEFFEKDVTPHGAVKDAGKIYLESRLELDYDEGRNNTQRRGDGYCQNANSGYKILFEGKQYVVRVTCISNSASHWFIVKGRTIFLS